LVVGAFVKVKSAEIQSGRRKSGRNTLAYTYTPFSAAPPRKRKAQAVAEVYWLQKPVDLFSFDEDYLRRLGAQDPATEAHFVTYFSERLKVTLRARGVDAHTLDEVRQETFCRVWGAVRSGDVHNPKGFGAYVHSVCKHVLSETRRDIVRNQHDPLEFTDVADEQLDLEDLMQQKQNGKLVREILAMLPERDRHILQARFFEERENDDVCVQFGIDRDYLRVLLHRAINKFGELYKKKSN
jgi:RNA polymerase sigma factor (sigma-70 family)